MAHAHPFIFPYGLIAFRSNLEFVDCLFFCQSNDFDVTDFSFYGFDYIAVFSVNDFWNLFFYCDHNAYQIAKFISFL